MSEYYNSLKGEDELRYQRKLEVIGLKVTDDHFESQNSCKYMDDMKKWPNLEYGNIFCYFVERPGVYTRQQLLSWKQLDAYNYFQNGYVRTVLTMSYSTGKSSYVVVKAMVHPSQNTPDKVHSTWIACKQNGDIITAHCTCKAG